MKYVTLTLILFMLDTTIHAQDFIEANLLIISSDYKYGVKYQAPITATIKLKIVDSLDNLIYQELHNISTNDEGVVLLQVFNGYEKSGNLQEIRCDTSTTPNKLFIFVEVTNSTKKITYITDASNCLYPLSKKYSAIRKSNKYSCVYWGDISK